MDNDMSVASNFTWKLLERFGAQTIAFVVSIILARLLSPEEYGVLAIMIVVINILEVFVDSGLGNALIQAKEVDDIDYSTIFFFNCFMCIILYLLLFIMAPYIENFYKIENLTSFLRIIGITILISGIKNIQHAYVSRNMIFKKFFYSTLVGSLVGAIVGIVMAYLGYGVWALISQQLINMSIDTIVLWITVPWRPKKLFSFDRLKKLFSFGYKILLTGLMGSIYNNINQLCIGKVYSSVDLAYYNKGKSWPNLLVSNINTSMDSVLLPTFSKNQHDIIILKEQCRKSLLLSAFILSPILIGLISISSPLTKIILTDKWMDSVIYMNIFALSYLFYPFQTANINILKALGRSDTYLKSEIIKRTVQLVLLLVCLKIGTVEVAISFLVTNLIGWFVFACPNKKYIEYSIYEQILDVIKPIICAIIMFGIISLLDAVLDNLFLLISMKIVSGAIIYIVFSVVFKVKGFIICMDIVKDILGNIKSKGNN